MSRRDIEQIGGFAVGYALGKVLQDHARERKEARQAERDFVPILTEEDMQEMARLRAHCDNDPHFNDGMNAVLDQIGREQAEQDRLRTAPTGERIGAWFKYQKPVFIAIGLLLAIVVGIPMAYGAVRDVRGAYLEAHGRHAVPRGLMDQIKKGIVEEAVASPDNKLVVRFTNNTNLYVPQTYADCRYTQRDVSGEDEQRVSLNTLLGPGETKTIAVTASAYTPIEDISCKTGGAKYYDWWEGAPNFVP